MPNWEELNRLTEIIKNETATPEQRQQWDRLREEIMREQEGPAGRRSFQRIAVLLEVTWNTPGGAVTTRSDSLGAGGMALRAPVDLQLGAQTELIFSLPGDSNTVTIPSRVVWTGPDQCYGVEFMEEKRHAGRCPAREGGPRSGPNEATDRVDL